MSGGAVLDIAISIEELTKVYRSPLGKQGVKALDHLSLEIKQGETLAIIGPNGSGKTTTLKLLLGLMYPTAGTAKILGESIFNVKAREKVGFLPEEPYFYDCFDGEELLDYYGKLFGIKNHVRRQRTKELLSLVGLAERRGTPLREYSKGMRQRAGLAQALINDPEVLILDEPTSGLDPEGAYQMRRLVRELRARGKTILLCSHFLAQVEDLCDRVAILNQGQLRACGSLSELVGESKRIEITATSGNAALVADLQKLAKKVSEQDGQVLAEIEEEDKLAPILDLLRARQSRLLEVRRPRLTLEELFIQVMKEGK
jgi:ABC-2 type transport system ATP-binding protein